MTVADTVAKLEAHLPSPKNRGLDGAVASFVEYLYALA